MLQDGCGFVTLDLSPDRVFELGEDQADAVVLEIVHEPREHVRRGRVPIADGRRGEHDAMRLRLMPGQLANLAAEGAGVREDEGRVKAVDDDAVGLVGIRVLPDVVVAGYPVDMAQDGLVRPPGTPEDVEDGQRYGDRDAG